MPTNRLTSITLAILLLAPLAALHAAEIRVGTKGSDNGPGTKKQPFATLTHARNAVRELKRQRLAEGPCTNPHGPPSCRKGVCFRVYSLRPT